MTDASRPSILPKPATTPSAGGSAPPPARRAPAGGGGVGARPADAPPPAARPVPVGGRGVRDVLEQRGERAVEGLALRVPVLDDPSERRRRERVDELPLLLLRHVPEAAGPARRGDPAPRQRGRRGPLPASGPDPVGAVEVGQHAPERRDAPLRAERAPGGRKSTRLNTGHGYCTKF